MKFKTISQQTPFRDTHPIVLLIEAETREEAFIKTYIELTKQGYNVITEMSNSDAKALNVDMTKINIPYFYTTSSVHIRSIQEFNF